MLAALGGYDEGRSHLSSPEIPGLGREDKKDPPAR